MKKGQHLAVVGLLLLTLLPCFSAQAQTWRELLEQADSLCDAARYDSAQLIAEMALEEAESRFSASDTAIALVLHRLGMFHNHQADYDSAESLMEEALAIRETFLGPEHPDVAVSLDGLARIYWEHGKYAEAEPLFERALTIREKTLGPDHLDVASSLHGLAGLYWDQSKDAEAGPLFVRALAIREKALGPDHPDVAESLNGLAGFYWGQGKYAEVEPLLQRALAIREKTLAPDHPDVGQSVNSLAVSYESQGKYAEAEPLFWRALNIWEKTLGPEHPNVAKSLNNLAHLYLMQGKYAGAEPLHQRALAIREKAFGPNHPIVARSLFNLAVLYCAQGKYAEAEALYKRALAIREEVLGPDNPGVGACFNSLASLYHDQGRYAEAEPLYKRMLAIWEKAGGAEHPAVALGLNNLAVLYTDQGSYAEAEPLLKRALAIWEKAFGRGHANTAACLANLADLYRDQHKHVEAESLYQQALRIEEKSFGPNHPYIADLCHDMALLFEIKKDFANAKKKAKRAWAIHRSSFRDGSAVLSERDALTYSKFMCNEANQYISILLDSQDTSSSCLKEMAEVVFSTKGQVSDGIFARHRTQAYQEDPNLKALSDSLRHARFKLANLYVQGPGQEDPEGYSAELSEVSKEKERLEAELARRSADFRRELELWELGAEKVAGTLPPRSILVEYMKFDRLKTARETEPHYLFVVVDSDGKAFASDLGSSDEIDSLVTLYRSHFQGISRRGGSPFSKDLEDYRRISASLYERIWRPVEDRLGGVDLVFIAPDGALNLVSFAGLTDGADRYLIEDYPIQYLSSGRDLVRLKESVETGSGLFALGDPDFDASASARLSSEAALTRVQESDTDLYALRNIRSGCETLNEITVLPLPGTRKEVERISEVWDEKSKEPRHAFFGAEASEDNFKRSAPGNRVIHLATHGYYAESDCRPELPKSRFGMSEAFVGENPLLLSGLFLAGANLHGEGAESLGVEDGILTAEEVTSMDLEGTKWVILSACESGLGEVKAGEGVYGLRRAFQMAGARTVISALWPVSDKSTAEMMSYLYGFEEDNLAFAMQSLARQRLAELRKRNQPDHPYLWAPFIALGDWR